MFTIDTKPPKYRQLEEYLKSKILTGAYKPGKRIPSEHQLIREFGLSNTTVQKAISTLVHEGLLIRHQGKGTFVAENVKEKLRQEHRQKEYSLVIDQAAFEEAISSSQNSFRYFDMIRGVSEAAADADCALKIEFLAREETPEATASRLLEKGSSLGAVLMGRGLEKALLDILKKKGFGFVVIGFATEDMKEELSNVFLWDTYQGVSDLTRYLLRAGYRRMGTLGYAGSGGKDSLREKALKEALSNAEVSWDEFHFLKCGPSSFDAFVAIHRLLEGGELPEVILAGSDEMAFGAMSALMEKGLRIPEDIGVVGFGDTPEAARTSPALTTLREPRYEVGRAAFEKLLECCEKNQYTFGDVVFPMELVARETCKAATREHLH
jgi:DNA-binding LacI/PurR family transcriptional regulator